MRYIKLGGTLLFALLLAVVPVLWMVASPAKAAAIPTFSIASVAPDATVTITTYNFPAHTSFTVRMGAFGTLGIGGVVVATTDSGAGGSFTATYSIPASLKGSAQIAIRMDATSGGFFAYNWFYNVTSGSSSGGWFTGIPTFSIVSVVPDTSVTIKTNNFPAHFNFTVRMGAFGTLGLGGTVVGTTDSGSGGAFTVSYNIPSGLKGDFQIAIRMDSTSGGFFAYNWFYNVTSGSGGTPPSGYSGFPTFSIKSVVKDNKVTILGYNFPPSETFTVRMNSFGTLGLGGTVVATTNTGSGGSFTATYSIPSGLDGLSLIAIRMDSPQGFFAYNWFYNTTATVP